MDSKECNDAICANSLDSGTRAHHSVTALSLADRDALVGVLESWRVSDLRQVLNLVDRRLAGAELIDRLSRDPRVHESALHELIVRSLWMFGIEYEQSDYCSNATLGTVVRRLFGLTSARLVDARQRPDIVMVPGGSAFCFAWTAPPVGALMARPALMVVELKRGGSRLTRHDMSQLDGYAHALAEAGELSHAGFIHGWVVGEDIAPRFPTDRLLCNADRCYARIRATTFSALSEAARRQLPNAFSDIRSRYTSMSLDGLIGRASG